jgi:hypothetical protein
MGRSRNAASVTSLAANSLTISAGRRPSSSRSRIWRSYAPPVAIAFSTMVGLVVTPVTAWSAISRSRPPEAMRSRESQSIQTD